MRLKPPKLIRRLMPDLIWEIDDPDGVFLTFDDGPTPGITEWILSTLEKYDAKATFFVLGKDVEMYPGLYQRILDDEKAAEKSLILFPDRLSQGLDLIRQVPGRTDHCIFKHGLFPCSGLKKGLPEEKVALDGLERGLILQCLRLMTEIVV